MLTLLKEWLGRTIKIDQTGDSPVIGRLVNVQQDYCSVFTETNQLVHYPLSQIKSVTANITELATVVPEMNEAYPPSFEKLVIAMNNRMVKVENGKKSSTGAITSVKRGYVQILKNTTEVIFYPLAQIKNISPVTILMQNKEENEQKNDKNDKKQDNTKAASKETHGSSHKEKHVVAHKEKHEVAHKEKHEVEKKVAVSNTRPVIFSGRSSNGKARSRGYTYWA